MEYKNGYIILDKQEVNILKTMFRTDIETSFEAIEFFRGMTDIRASLIEERRRYLSMNDRGSREDAAISLLELTIDVCEDYIAKAHEVSHQAGRSIELH